MLKETSKGVSVCSWAHGERDKSPTSLGVEVARTWLDVEGTGGGGTRIAARRAPAPLKGLSLSSLLNLGCPWAPWEQSLLSWTGLGWLLELPTYFWPHPGGGGAGSLSKPLSGQAGVWTPEEAAPCDPGCPWVLRLGGGVCCPLCMTSQCAETPGYIRERGLSVGPPNQETE